MQIISNHISCIVLPGELEEAITAGYSEIYAMTSKGIVKHHRLRGQGRFVRVKVDTIPNYKEPVIEQEVQFLPAGKIPIELFDQVVSFFKQVMEVKKSELEAMIWVCWDAENGYHLIVPEQRVSKASASYDWSSLPAGKTIVCDIHSHNTMGAFFSGTDNRDDQGNIGFSGVVGHLKSPNPQTVWRFNYKDKKFECDFDDIFALPPRADQVIPDDWITKISTPAYAPAGYGGNSQKGKADHLAPWRYPKGQNGNNAVNREGPHLRAGTEDRRSLPDAYGNNWENNIRAGKTHIDIGNGEIRDINDFWNFDASLIHPNDDFDLTGGLPDERFSSAERALALLNEDPAYDEHRSTREIEVGVAQYNPQFDPDIPLRERLGEGELDTAMYAGDDRFEEIEGIHGKDVADTFCLIDDCMSTLSGKDDLVKDLMLDMIHMASEGAQAEIFGALFQELPEKAQERIQTNGIH
jgi:PRTRC genetic system protein A